jgi:hypothetical protein
MFLKKSNVGELASALESNLTNLQTSNLTRYQQRQTAVLQCLETAANLFDEVGLEKEASVITSLMMKLAENDPATSGLTDEKMLKNLEEKGWVFNVSDGQPSATNGTSKPQPQANDQSMAADDSDVLEVEDAPAEQEPEELLQQLGDSATLVGHPES